MTDLGAALRQVGEEEEAEQCLLEGQAIAQDIGHAHLRTGNLLAWGDLHLQRDDLDLAATAFAAAKQLAAEANLQTELALAWYGLARLAAARRDVAGAWRLGQESQRLFEPLGDYRAGVVQHWVEQFAHLSHASSDGGPMEERARRNGRPSQGRGPREAPEC